MSQHDGYLHYSNWFKIESTICCNLVSTEIMQTKQGHTLHVMEFNIPCPVSVSWKTSNQLNVIQ